MLQVGAATLSVEIADEPAERNRGLMHREQLPADTGMLFVYPDAAPRSFWMKDTPLPLSIAFVDPDGRIVSISDMTPRSTASVPSGAPAMYAIEVPQGWFAEHGVAVGDVVRGLPERSAK